MVNVTGSFVIGLVASSAVAGGRWLASAEFRTFMMVGICGGYTTFSSFSLQTMKLAGDGQWLYAGLNIVGSVALCLIFVWLGHVSASSLNR
jgi:CrcB protein